MTKHFHHNSSVIYAFFGNLVITFLKFIGYLMTFSPSLFSEAMHSLADTCNQGLLWFGIKQSKRKADANHSYGYGAERFFWAVISACGIFFIGSLFTIYHGIISLQNHSTYEVSFFIYFILIISFLIESFTLHKAYKEIHPNIPENENTFRENLQDADPVSVAVFYEDLVAVLGIIIAFFSILITKITGNYIFDAAGSILIGLLLAVVAIILLSINRKYLLGKSIPEEVAEEIIELLENDKHIDKVIDFKSEVLDIGKYYIKCEIEFNGYAIVDEIFKTGDLQNEYENIKEDYEEFKKFVIYQTNQVPRMVGRVIDHLEKEIKLKFPKVEHIDLEIN